MNHFLFMLMVKEYYYLRLYYEICFKEPPYLSYWNNHVLRIIRIRIQAKFFQNWKHENQKTLYLKKKEKKKEWRAVVNGYKVKITFVKWNNINKRRLNLPLYEREPGLLCPDNDISGEMRERQVWTLVGDTVGLLLLLFLSVLLCLLCLRSELTGKVARIGPCFDVEHGEDFRILCDVPDILLTYKEEYLGFRTWLVSRWTRNRKRDSGCNFSKAVYSGFSSFYLRF